MSCNIAVNDSIYIRELLKDDIEFLRVLRNRSVNRKNFIYQKEISYESQQIWFNSYLKNFQDYMYSVVRKSDDSIIGFAAIYDINNNEAEFGRLIVDKDKYNQPGLGKFILKYLINVARDKFHLQKLKLEVFADNIPALKIYEQCGFKEYDRASLDNRILIKMELYL